MESSSSVGEGLMNIKQFLDIQNYYSTLVKLKILFVKQSIKQFLAQTDQVLQKIIDQIPEPAIVSTQEVFNDLMSCILEQQIHYRSTKKTFQKMLEASALDKLTLANFHTFEEKGLTKFTLSTQKYETVLQIIDFFEQDHPDWPSLTDAEIRSLLIPIKGISHWTIDMILLYTLERDNIFPGDDYHLKKIMTQCYALDARSKLKAQMKAIAETWSPYKSHAVLYLLEWKKLKP